MNSLVCWYFITPYQEEITLRFFVYLTLFGFYIGLIYVKYLT